MNDVVGDAMLTHLDGSFTNHLYNFTSQTLGTDAYSMKGWVGSHPDFQPCDVAPVARRGWFKSLMQGLKYDEYIPNSYSDSDGRIYDFLWNPALRRTLAPPGSLLEHRLIEVEKRRDLAFREYHYLAGNLFRWYKLYGRAPLVGSWVWSWFTNMLNTTLNFNLNIHLNLNFYFFCSSF